MVVLRHLQGEPDFFKLAANEMLHLEIVNRREAKVIWMGKK